VAVAPTERVRHEIKVEATVPLSSGGIPDDVRRFVVDYIDSVELLEVFLFLRANAGRDWSAGEVAAELRIAEESAAGRMVTLVGAALVGDEGGRFRYGPKSAALDRTAIELARIYPERRFTIIEIIFSKPNEKIRSFSDAFRIRRDRER
jgi:hypothetical protein